MAEERWKSVSLQSLRSPPTMFDPVFRLPREHWAEASVRARGGRRGQSGFHKHIPMCYTAYKHHFCQLHSCILFGLASSHFRASFSLHVAHLIYHLFPPTVRWHKVKEITHAVNNQCACASIHVWYSVSPWDPTLWWYWPSCCFLGL